MTERALLSRFRASYWRPSLYALALVASCAQPPDVLRKEEGATRAEEPHPGVRRPIDPCKCGPIDVVFAVDVTGSMGSSLSDFQSNFSNLLQDIQTSSSNDYRLGLVTFDDDVHVLDDLAMGNDASVSANVAGLPAAGGLFEPEASDEALNTVLNHLSSSGDQTGDFHGLWRTGARRFVVLITDAHPGGFNDSFDGADVTHAHQMALKADQDEVKIHAVYVTHGAPIPTIQSVMQDYASTSNGLYRETCRVAPTRTWRCVTS